MATFVTPTDDIIVQEGTFGYTFIASGAISGAQLVKSAGPMQVLKATSSTDNAIGIAAYTVTKGKAVTVYGPFNIVRSYLASAATVGTDLYIGNLGAFNSGGTATVIGGTEPCVGIALESKAAGSTCRILLK
ncbi:MAG: DUF2190 family protein [Actinobacteria bacterium]|nr:DUF2190 family protein [Actinomycetota bacterium]MBE3114593.1 DUF2190 family protein [Actinomycetota bacterium]